MVFDGKKTRRLQKRVKVTEKRLVNIPFSATQRFRKRRRFLKLLQRLVSARYSGLARRTSAGRNIAGTRHHAIFRRISVFRVRGKAQLLFKRNGRETCRAPLRPRGPLTFRERCEATSRRRGYANFTRIRKGMKGVATAESRLHSSILTCRTAS